ncbi:MAG: beta-ketoacyl-[acyl-carrier-protein] synthase family protein [Pseudomonadota bacterium]
MARRVVVTGLGAVASTGMNVPAFWEAATSGKSGIKSDTIVAGEDLKITAPMARIEGFDDVAADLGRDIARTDNFTKFAVVASDEAIEDAGLHFSDEMRTRTATIIGTGIGGQEAMNTAYIGMLTKGKRAHPLTILKTIPNAAASQLSIRHGLTGPAFAVSSACASGAHAIGVTAELIKSGAADIGVTGASEAVLTYGSLEAWKAMHILSSDQCRPFSKNRNGLVIGEGAGILVLEEYDHARARGAKVYAELVGFGMNADGKDMINPAVEGAAGAMSLALNGIDQPAASEIYINAHGTGTLMNDPTETKAIREVFGVGADDLIVSSTKSMHGHLLGAAGGVETIMAIKALETGIVPPTINFEEPDPECDLNITPNEAQERSLSLTLSNSFAFGGLNAVVAFARI